MLVLKLGWRNLWRNSRRSLINISAIATAFAFIILLLGLGEGMKRQMLENGTGLMLGHLQLHHPDYLPDRSFYDTLGRAEARSSDLVREVESKGGVLAASPRVYGFALLSTGENSSGGQLMGILPGSEHRLTTILDELVEGDLDLEPGAWRLLLGEILAQELKAGLGSEVAAVTQAADGSLGNNLFRVSGILRTGLPYLDRSLAIVHLADLQELLVMEEGRVHEIAVKIEDALRARAFSDGLNEAGSLSFEVRASSWEELLPQLRDYVNLSGKVYAFFIALVAIFAALGILNTMMMAVFERTREIGTVASLGMMPGQIVASILAESAFLSLIGLSAGLVVGALLMQHFTTEGLDLSRWMGELAIANTHMDPVIVFYWSWGQVAASAVGLAVASVLAAGLPARRASRMNPVEAVRAHQEA